MLFLSEKRKGILKMMSVELLSQRLLSLSTERNGLFIDGRFVQCSTI